MQPLFSGAPYLHPCGLPVHIVTYNILAADLLSPDLHRYAPRGFIGFRRGLIHQKLMPHIHSKAILCLQEVRLDDESYLRDVFQVHQYTTYISHDRHAQLKVMIAVPTDIFYIMEAKSELPTMSQPDFPPSFGLGTGVNPGGEISPFYLAKERQRCFVFLRLFCRLNNGVFCVGTYHMPVLHTTPQAQFMLTSFLMRAFHQFRGQHPGVLAGDFNFTPDSASYRLMVSAQHYSALEDIPQKETCRTVSCAPIDVLPFLPTREMAMRSAFMSCINSEPNFTTYTCTRTERDFIATIDYIFVSPEINLLCVFHPDQGQVQNPLPSDWEPSDHLMVCALIQILPPSIW